MSEPWEKVLSQGSFKPCTLLDFIRDKKKIEIPKFQRPYRWTSHETQFFLRDILDNGSKERPWFLGMLYYQESEASPAALMLDGQQRVTTWFLFLIELRRLLYIKRGWLQGREWEQWTEFLDDCYGHTPNTTLGYQCKLKVDSGWEKYFQAEGLNNLMKASQVPAGSASEKWDAVDTAFISLQNQLEKTSGGFSVRLAHKNRLFIREWLQDKIAKFCDLQSVMWSVEYGLWVVPIPLKLNSDSRLLFEGINSRGMPLDLLDKIRFRMLTDDIWDSRQAAKKIKQVDEMWGCIFEEMQPCVKEKIYDGEELLELYLRGALELGMTLPSSMSRHEDWWLVIKDEHLGGENLDADKILVWLSNFVKFLKTLNWLLLGIEPNSAKVPFVDVTPLKSGLSDKRWDSLVCMVKVALSISENFKWCLATSLVEDLTMNTNSSNRSVAHKWYDAILAVYREEVVQGVSSNVVRLNMFGYGSSRVPEVFNKKNRPKVGVRAMGYDQLDARFVILLSSFLRGDDWDILTGKVKVGKARKTKDSPHVDHFCPKSWTKNWPTFVAGAQPTRILSWLQMLQDRQTILVLAGDYGLWIEFVEGIKRPAGWLVECKSAPKHSVVNLLGNKFVTDAKRNVGKRNGSLADGLAWYDSRVQTGTAGYVYPVQDSVFGWGALSVVRGWRASDVLKRSVGLNEELIVASATKFSDWKD